jgi:hypothetical protein
MRRVTTPSDFFDQALRLTGFVDVTGAAAKLAVVGISNTGVVAAQGRVYGRVDQMLIWSPTAQEIQLFEVQHSIGSDAGAVQGTLAPNEPSLILKAQALNASFATWKFTDGSTIAGGVQVGQLSLLANTVLPITIPFDLNNLTSVYVQAVTAASRLVGIFTVRSRHMRNPVLLQSGG